jgi:hypothetical protein
MGHEEESENLFSYGTLQEEAVQLGNFGRRLAGEPDMLAGYIVTMIPIQDQNLLVTAGETHYRNIKFTGISSDTVGGTVFRVTQKELHLADAYEITADYVRVLVQLMSGMNAWVYLNSRQ